MSIIKRTNKFGISYLVRVRGTNGKFLPSKTFRKKIDAEKYRSQLLCSKTLLNNSYPAPSSLCLDDYYSSWFDKNNLHSSEGWRKTLRQLYRDHIKPVVGNMKINKFNRNNAVQVFEHMKSKGLGGQQQRHVYTLIRRIFRDFINEYATTAKNPITNDLRPNVSKKETPYLGYDELMKLLDSTKDEWFGSAVWLGGLAGLRISEIQALKWNDLSLEAESPTIRIHRAYKRKEKVIHNYPKGKNQFSKTLIPKLSEYLSEVKAKTKPFGNDFVCSNSDKSMMSQSTFDKILKRKCKELGIRRISAHGLRHSFSALMYKHTSAGVDDISKMLGHSSTKSTMTYIHGQHERANEILRNLKLD